MKYEITNSIDKCFIESDDLQVARCVAFVLGKGAYGLSDEHGESVLPTFMLGGADEWISKNMGDLADIKITKKHKVIECLDSFSYPYKQSSPNNIGGRAKAISIFLKNDDVAKLKGE